MMPGAHRTLCSRLFFRGLAEELRSLARRRPPMVGHGPPIVGRGPRQGARLMKIKRSFVLRDAFAQVSGQAFRAGYLYKAAPSCPPMELPPAFRSGEKATCPIEAMKVSQRGPRPISGGRPPHQMQGLISQPSRPTSASVNSCWLKSAVFLHFSVRVFLFAFCRPIF